MINLKIPFQLSRNFGLRVVVPVALLFCLAFPSCNADSEGPSEPNIIFILADDLGYSDLGCYGGEINTPNLDKLASEGMRFSQFYNSGKCEPTRASILSGLYWPTTKLGLKKGMTMGEVMQEAGYATYATGKWHIDGEPLDRGFDRYFGHLSGATDYFTPHPRSEFRLDKEPYDAFDSDFYTTDAFTDYAMEFIEDGKEKDPDKPFFLYLAYNAPHNPLQVPEEEIKKYRGEYVDGWDHIRKERFSRQLDMGLFKQEDVSLPARPLNLPAWDSLNPGQVDLEDLRMAVYAGMIDRMDQNIGRLINWLEQEGMYDNTLVIFMSDNGASPFSRTDDHMLANDKLPGDRNSNWEIGNGWGYASNTPFRLYKRYQHEGGVCAPFIARFPGVVEANEITHQPAHIIDLMPTFLELSGGEYPDNFQGKANPPLPGKSLLPIFEGKTREAHDELYFLLFDHAGMRKGDWKISRLEGKDWELFNFSNDRTEANDLASEHPVKLNEMTRLFDAWIEESNMEDYNVQTPDDMLLDDRGGGNLYVPSEMPDRLKGRK